EMGLRSGSESARAEPRGGSVRRGARRAARHARPLSPSASRVVNRTGGWVVLLESGRRAARRRTRREESRAMSRTSIATRGYLTEAQVAAYRRDGYLAVPGLIEPERIAELRRVTEAFVERSRA